MRNMASNTLSGSDEEEESILTSRIENDLDGYPNSSTDESASNVDSCAGNIESVEFGYKCKICKKRFSTRGKRDYHFRKVHAKKARIFGQLYRKDLRTGRWSCTICRFSTRQFSAFRYHIRFVHRSGRSSAQRSIPQSINQVNTPQVCNMKPTTTS
jgi:hypothetical protein